MPSALMGKRQTHARLRIIVLLSLLALTFTAWMGVVFFASLNCDGGWSRGAFLVCFYGSYLLALACASSLVALALIWALALSAPEFDESVARLAGKILKCAFPPLAAYCLASFLLDRIRKTRDNRLA